MGPLKNVRRERFCLALAEGMSQAAAYRRAGYKESASSNANAARLIAIDSVAARAGELKAEAATRNQITVESLARELEHARQRADSLDQIAASVAAIKIKAQIAGISEQRIRVSYVDESFNDCDSLESVVARFADLYESQGIELDEKQRMEFGRIVRDAIASVDNFLAPFKAKAVASVPQIRAPMHEIERKRLGLRSNR